MQKLFCFITISLTILNSVCSQEPRFNHVISDKEHYGFITDIAQDQQGFIWLATADRGLLRYDGLKIKSFLSDRRASNAVAADYIRCLSIDRNNTIWIGTIGSGLDKFDPTTNTYTHLRHNPKDDTSLSNDTVTAVLEDRSGNLWVGTFGGLNLLDRKTGKFIHYKNNVNDSSSLSYNRIWVIYEDKKGELWIGCGLPYHDNNEKLELGGLNRFDKTTQKFTHYLHDPSNPNSIAGNKIGSIYEDKKGNFWVGTNGDGLHTMDRNTGVFTHYYYDPSHPEKTKPPTLVQHNGRRSDHFYY